MNKSNFKFPRFHCLPAGQGLAEYAILIAIIAVLTIFGLTLVGGSVQGGLIKVCAGLGNDDCQAAQQVTAVAGTVTPTAQVSATPSVAPTATLALSEPDPTRESVPPVVVGVPPVVKSPTPAVPMITMRIKVVINGKDDDKKSVAGIRVVIYTADGKYVTEGMTDEKGNVSLSVAKGNYIVATYYKKVWQKDGPFNVTKSKENVIHRSERGDDDDD